MKIVQFIIKSVFQSCLYNSRRLMITCPMFPKNFYYIHVTVLTDERRKKFDLKKVKKWMWKAFFWGNLSFHSYSIFNSRLSVCVCVVHEITALFDDVVPWVYWSLSVFLTLHCCFNYFYYYFCCFFTEIIDIYLQDTKYPTKWMTINSSVSDGTITKAHLYRCSIHY